MQPQNDHELPVQPVRGGAPQSPVRIAGELARIADPALLLVMRGIDKAFGPVRVLEAVTLECWAGEVHAICGENGAGKSTLIKVLGGVYQADRGTIEIGGRPVDFSHPAAARRAGVGIIHQELSLLPHRTVADNIFLGLERSRQGFLDRGRMQRDAAALLLRLGSRIPPDRRAGTLSIAEQQLVEIAKALALDTRILVFDEPTAALDATESEALFGVIAELRRAGVAVIYISHRMREVFALADRITVIKDGRGVWTARATEVTPESVIRSMVGRPLEDLYPPRTNRAAGDALLRLERAGNGVLRDVTMMVRAGEIVGIAGLEGSGKGALARAIFGAAPFMRGAVSLPDGGGAAASAREGARRGVAYLSDDRKAEGLGLRQSLRDNAALVLRGLGGALAPPWAGTRAKARLDDLFRAVEVRAASFALPAGALSGGNQQKILIARWLAAGVRLWVVVEPTRGIDVGAKATVYRLLRQLADDGGGVLVISSDLTEIIGLSDRILVMAEGTVAAELPAGASEEAILARAVMHGQRAARAA